MAVVPHPNEFGTQNEAYIEVVVPEGEDPWEYIPPVYIGNPIAPNRYCRRWNGKPTRMHYCGSEAGSGTEHLGYGRCYRHGGRAQIITGERIRASRYKALKHRTLGDLISKFAEDPDPLNVLAELDMARALLVDFVERHGEFTEQLVDWHDSFKQVKQPMSEEDALAFQRCVEEYAILLAERGDPTDAQIVQVAHAKRFLVAYRQPVDQGRPRKVIDILDALKAVDSIGKLVERLDKRDTISEPELNRIFSAMARVVDVIVTDPEQKRLIREGWMRAVTR